MKKNFKSLTEKLLYYSYRESESGEILELFVKLYERVCCNILRPDGIIDAEEIMQIRRIAIWKALEKYDPDRGVALSWYVFNGVRNSFSSLVRKYKGKKHICEIRIDSLVGDNVLHQIECFSKCEEELSLTFFDFQKILTDEEYESVNLLNYGFKKKDIATNFKSIKEKISLEGYHV